MRYYTNIHKGGSIFSMFISDKLTSKQLVVGFLAADIAFLLGFNYSTVFY